MLRACGRKLAEQMGPDRSAVLPRKSPISNSGVKQAPLEIFAIGDGEAIGENVWEAGLRKDDGNEDTDMSISKEDIFARMCITI
jgi:hypothetical protein